jgi:hypothetical protein
MKLPLHLFLIVLLLLAAAIAAGGKTDFSWAYTLTKIKGGEFGVGPKKGTVWGLEVVQTATAIEVTKVRNGRRFVHTFSLDGTEGVYNDPSGNTGTCKGHFKGRYLYLDSFVIFRTKGGPTIQSHTMERWELSAMVNLPCSGGSLDPCFLPSRVFARCDLPGVNAQDQQLC